MNISSLNIRGLGGKAKKMALRKFLIINNIDIVLIQETIDSSLEFFSILDKMIKAWFFMGIDSTRNSGGLITKWWKSI